MTHKPSLRDVVRRATATELPRRFYETATVGPEDGLLAVLLDGRPVRTPAKQRLAVKDAAVAEALAAEWQGQGERIDPGTMPLTRIVNAAIDRVAGEMAAVRGDIVAYGGSDLLCYRADGPEDLVDRQNAVWSPLLDWARQALGARFILAEGVVHVTQQPETLAAIDRALERFDALQLAALHVVTTLAGSAIIALALAAGRLTPDEAWLAAHLDEDWQMSRWGADEVALSRRAARRREFDAAALILAGSADSSTGGDAT